MANYGIHDPRDARAKPVLAIDLLLQSRVESGADGQPVYLGFAAPDAKDTDLKWLIKKMTYSGGVFAAGQFADQANTFTKRWDQRATYDYDPDT